MKKMKKFLAGMLAIACTFSAFSMTACELNVDEIIGKVKDELPFEDEETDETPDNGSSDNGSSDGGSSDGGSSDGGSSDDGSSDGGSSDNGSSDNGSSDNGSSDNGSSDEPTSGGITITDGVQYLRAGGTYALSNSVAFLSTDVVTTSSTYTPVTSTLTATVEPIDADQRVDWTYVWVNASSTWAAGKTLTDYMTIAPKSDGSTSLDVTCKQAFGEPIKITCTSRAYNNISASTVVDFLAVPELQTVTLGSGSNAITVNLGGETTVKYDYKGTSYGGELSVGDYKSSTASVYTKLAEVGNYDTFQFDLVSPSVYYDEDEALYTYADGYLIADVQDVLGSSIVGVGFVKTYTDDIAIAFKKGQTSFATAELDNLLYFRTLTGLTVGSRESLSENDTADIIEVFDTISENSLYTFVLHTEIGGATKTYYSLMKLEIV